MHRVREGCYGLKRHAYLILMIYKTTLYTGFYKSANQKLYPILKPIKGKKPS
jgi:hypothetical protein